MLLSKRAPKTWRLIAMPAPTNFEKVRSQFSTGSRPRKQRPSVTLLTPIKYVTRTQRRVVAIETERVRRLHSSGSDAKISCYITGDTSSNASPASVLCVLLTLLHVMPQGLFTSTTCGLVLQQISFR